MAAQGLRNLGRSGLRVSPLCLGAMNFGNEQFGCDEADLDRRHPRLPRRRSQLHRHRQRLLGDALGDDRRQGGEGPPRRRRHRHQGGLAARARPVRLRLQPQARRQGLRGQPAPAGHRLHRPLPDAPLRRRDAARGDAQHAQRPRPRRARFATSASRTGPPRRSSRPAWSSRRRAGSRWSACSRSTASSPATSRSRSCRPAASSASASIPWSPLAGGMLTGKYKPGEEPQEGTRFAAPGPFQSVWRTRSLNERNHAIVSVVLEEARQLNAVADRGGPGLEPGAAGRRVADHRPEDRSSS